MAHPLSGADIGTLARIFRAGGAPDNWLTAAGIWGAAIGRAPISALEAARWRGRLPEIADAAPPIFILGHWRSGTTHLYNTLCLGGYGSVSPIAVGLPWDMLGLARWLRPFLERQLPEHRWIDMIPVTPTSPQEDEIGVASMSPLSFYHGVYFPKRFDALIDRGLFFDGCSDAEIARHEERFLLFLRKVSVDQGGRRLLLKNPVHTGRVARLRALFPGAKFVHIHRSPFDVFLSMRNFYAKLLAVMALQRPPPDLDVDATILRVYRRMMTLYDRDTADMAEPELVELDYPSLDRDPVGALKRIYDGLALDGFEASRPAFEGYLASVRSYEKNAFPGDAAAVAKVAEACAPWIERWGYAAPEPAAA